MGNCIPGNEFPGYLSFSPFGTKRYCDKVELVIPVAAIVICFRLTKTIQDVIVTLLFTRLIHEQGDSHHEIYHR